MARAKYEPWLEAEGLGALEAWARAGLEDAQIACNMGISPGTLAAWKGKYPRLAHALACGRGGTEAEVEGALLRRALGYEYTETTVEEGSGQPKVKKVTKHMHPDLSAQMFWLQKRGGKGWRGRADKAAPLEGDFELVISGEEDKGSEAREEDRTGDEPS